MTHPTNGSNSARELCRLDGILDMLRDHLANGGSPGDYETARLYRDYYGMGTRTIAPYAVRSWAERHITPPAAATTDGA